MFKTSWTNKRDANLSKKLQKCSHLLIMLSQLFFASVINILHDCILCSIQTKVTETIMCILLLIIICYIPTNFSCCFSSAVIVWHSRSQPCRRQIDLSKVWIIRISYTFTFQCSYYFWYIFCIVISWFAFNVADRIHHKMKSFLTLSSRRYIFQDDWDNKLLLLLLGIINTMKLNVV